MSVFFNSGYAGENFDMRHPRIGWNSITRRGTIVASSTADGFSAAEAATPLTYSYWRPVSLPATYTITLPMAEDVGFVGLVGPGLGTSGVRIRAQVDRNGSFIGVGPPAEPTGRDEVMILFGTETTTRVRLIFSQAAPTIAVIAAGPVIEMPSRVYKRLQTPIDMATVTEFNLNRARSGQYLGRSVRAQRNMNDFPVSHLPEPWVRQTLQPFLADALEYPFFLAERPATTPDAVSYRWPDADIVPRRMGVLNHMEVVL